MKEKNTRKTPYTDELDQFLESSTSSYSSLDDIVANLTRLAGEYLPAEQLPQIEKAYRYALKAHEGQKRLSGEPYIIHPLRATEILMGLKPDMASIVTCILHDVIEDTPVGYKDIEKSFGTEVAILCEGLVKVSKIRYKGEQRQIETLKKTFLAMAKDLRVIFVKVADRVHNIQTLRHHPNPDKRRRIAMETLRIYVPICKKLGLYNYQLYLENGTFSVLYPEGYRRVLNYLQRNYGKSDYFIEQGRKKMAKVMAKNGLVDFEIKGRIKSPFRIYEKLTRKYKTTDFSKILDVLAFRVIVNEVGDCYQTLGIFHKIYNPLINKIKDYIAVPKFNNYQSLHTTVLGVFDFPIEIQIRTKHMEQIAEYGVAAHFAYSDPNAIAMITDKQSKWIRQLKDLVHEYKETSQEDKKEEFKNNLDIEVLNKKIFIYTPKGDVLEFPEGSTLLDFAFRVHTDLGLRFKNGLVGGVIKPIGHVLASGDVVSVKTFKNKYTANKHWMEFLHTPTAKAKLSRFIRKQERDIYINRATELFNKKLEGYGLPLLGQDGDRISPLLGNEEEIESFLLSFLDRQQSPLVVIREAYPAFVLEKEKELQERLAAKKKISDTLIMSGEAVVDGLHQLPYDCCKHCNPTTEDKIIAKVDKNGIKIHKLSCAALKSISFQKLMEAHWRGQEVNVYTIKMVIRMTNDSDNLVSLMNLCKDLHIEIGRMSVDHEDDGFAVAVESAHQNPTKIAYLVKDLKKQYGFITSIKTYIK